MRAVLGGSWFVAGAVTGYLVPMAVATSAMPQHSEITLGVAICILPSLDNELVAVASERGEGIRRAEKR